MTVLQIERLAYWLWQQRGMPCGSPHEDWFLAEQLIRTQYLRLERSMKRSLFAFGVERMTK
jgi:hypothetical protein